MDSNGTNFGYNPGPQRHGRRIRHNDFYPVAVAAAQLADYGRLPNAPGDDPA